MGCSASQPAQNKDQKQGGQNETEENLNGSTQSLPINGISEKPAAKTGQFNSEPMLKDAVAKSEDDNETKGFGGGAISVGIAEHTRILKNHYAVLGQCKFQQGCKAGSKTLSMGPSAVEVENEYYTGLALPDLVLPQAPVDFACLRGYSSSKWPIRNYTLLSEAFNVNAGPGGCASIVQVSTTYNRSEGNSQVFLHRGGFDGNHHSYVSLAQNSKGHFGVSTSFDTNEIGKLVPDCLFGENHISLMSNDCRYGHLGHGILAEGVDDDITTCLPLNVLGGLDESGCGDTLILCSGWESGMDGATFASALYTVHSGNQEDILMSALIKGDDKWKFSAGNDNMVQVTGLSRSRYALFHNRKHLIPKTYKITECSKSFHTQTVNGGNKTTLLSINQSSGVILIICSNTSGTEDASCAALYLLSISAGSILSSVYVAGCTGKGFASKEADLWKYEISNNSVLVLGPKGPCRYATVSNFTENINKPQERCKEQLSCLVTGKNSKICGAVKVTNESITGWVSEPVSIAIVREEKLMFKLDKCKLVNSSGKFAFHHKWKKSEITVGLQVVRAYAWPEDVKEGCHQWLELEGSPSQVIQQPPGVTYALNCSGPAYQALNNIVYTSEHSQFANFDRSYGFGTRSRSFGGVKSLSNQYHMLTGTLDGFMYVTQRSPGVEAVDEQKVLYEVNNIPNGKYTLRVHGSGSCNGIDFNGSSVSKEISKQVKKQPDILGGYTAHWADVPVTVKDKKLSLYMTTQFVSSFALLDKSYSEWKLTAEEQASHTQMRQKLIDEVEPLTRTLTWKERQIVGWSHNLVVNASGEMGSVSHWQCHGDWIVAEGGYGTEKSFVTSHMRCQKEQIIDLTEHFSSSYLDSAPEIQVCEWYKEGCCGGGFYGFEASIIDGNGKEIKGYKSGEIGTLYREQKWMQESVKFNDYGPGVRRVRISSWGKDDKHWGGHYGPYISAADVRVKRESTPDKNDAFTDVFEGNAGEDLAKKNSSSIDKMISRVISSNQALLDEITVDEVNPEVDSAFGKEFGSNSSRQVDARKRYKRKKREIRVFVSSTFRDFKKERETLIKKTFREINALCADRGVFFTYVDLRWGITEEQTNHGKTIAICLQEISRCRPYFICMMGERFGWSQREDSPDELLNESYNYAISNHPDLAWIDQHRYGSSVTQLEILCGVLNDVEANKHRAFFYLRDPVQGDNKAMLPESDWHKTQQYQMREAVESSNILNVNKYKEAEEVCEKIRKDLEWCVNEDFPRGTELTPLEREREAHMAFADARRRVYIGREEYFKNIDAFMSDHKGIPLVILGESGSGKSALVANWYGRVEEKEPESFVFVHFIGSSAESASYLKLLRRLYEEMKIYFKFDLAVPGSDSQLCSDLSTWLRMAGSQTRCVIVLDALNQLDDGSGTEGAEHDLSWIPRVLPPGVYMLLSTLPGRAMEAVKTARWETMQVAPLAPEEKMEIVTGYMEGLYSKTLSQDQKDMMVNAAQTDNPLYLKALLDEVRMYGNFRLLSKKIQEYLLAESCHELFVKILERLEEDFEKGQHERPGLVRQTTAAIWCSHKGMSETELLEFLEVPSAVWSPFYLSLVENLVNRNGILNFFHDHLRQAVESKYLPTPEDKKKGYLELANFFSNRPVDDRVAEELPVILAKAGELEQLKSVVSDLNVFRRLVQSEDGKFELIRAWKLLGDFSQVESAYLDALSQFSHAEEGPESLADTEQELAEFFLSLGLFDTARSLFERLLKQLEDQFRDSHSTFVYSAHNHSRKYMCKHPAIIDLLQKLGTVCEKLKDFGQAIKYYEDAIARQNRLENPAQKLQLAQCLLGLATVYILQENMKEGKKFLVRARELSTKVLGPRHHYVAAIINKLGELMYKQGLLDDALGYFIQDLNLTRSLVGAIHPRTAGILNDIALVYDDKGDKLAGQLYEGALLTLLDTYGPAHLDVALIRYNLGSFYFANNSYARAKYQFTESLKVYEAFLGSDHQDTQEVKKALTDVASFTD